MNKQPVVFCRDCKFSKADQNFTWKLKCLNEEVSRRNPIALASIEEGTDCVAERKSRFGVCGMKGKKFEPKEEAK